MAANRVLIWKALPIEQIRQVTFYLKEEYSLETAEKFISKIIAKTDRILEYPESGQMTKYKTIRRLRIDKYHSLYYRQHGRKIIILFMWDGRQHPSKNKY